MLKSDVSALTMTGEGLRVHKCVSEITFFGWQLKECKEAKDKLSIFKRTLQTKYYEEKKKQANSLRQEARIKREILDSADIVCTTLNGAGSTSLKHDLQLAGRLELY